LVAEENNNIEHKNEREVEGICEKIKIDFEHRAKLKIRRKQLDYWQYQY
jgi:hypothetical protein